METLVKANLFHNLDLSISLFFPKIFQRIIHPKRTCCGYKLGFGSKFLSQNIFQKLGFIQRVD